MQQTKTLQLPPVWGNVMPDYRPIKVIGKGAFGQIVKAFSIKHQRNVAIKYLDCVQLKADRCRLLYFRELAILRQLSQMPEAALHVSGLLDVVAPPEGPEEASGEYLFLVLELQPMDLLRFLDNKLAGEMEEKDIIRMVYQLLCHLQFLHSAGLLHRDLKPANVLVDSELNLKICDFGLSRSIPRNEMQPPAVLREKSNRVEIVRSLNHSREERDSKNRQMSRHVTSRWYRPPEVILLEKNYTESVDLWSLGCIVMELIYCSKAYRSKIKSTKNRILFKGDSCYPLSPRQDKELSEQDQLAQIVKILGDPDSSDLSFITVDQNRQYAESLSHGLDKIRFQKELGFSSPALVQLLESLLEFNPYFRPSAASLLKSPIFDEVRIPELEKPAPYKILLEEPLGIRFNNNRKKVVEGDLTAALQHEIREAKAYFKST